MTEYSEYLIHKEEQQMIIGVDTCRRHSWVWLSMAKAKCSNCNKEQAGHAREATSRFCLVCNEDH